MNQLDLTTAPPSSASDIETVARQIAVTARKMSGEIDDDRRLPGELVALLGDSGLLRAGAPVEVRGLELPPGVAARLQAYHHAGADNVAIVPATAEDPGGRAVLAAVASARTEC